MIAIPMTVSVDNPSIMMDTNASQQEVPLGIEAEYKMVAATDYEQLENKPQINGVTLIGNKLLMDLFPDGIIINGGDSTGYTPPVVPTGVPSAEGVEF